VIARAFSHLWTKCEILIRYRNEEKWLHWSSSSNRSGCTKALCRFLDPCYFFLRCNVELHLLPVIRRSACFVYVTATECLSLCNHCLSRNRTKPQETVRSAMTIPLRKPRVTSKLRRHKITCWKNIWHTRRSTISAN